MSILSFYNLGQSFGALDIFTGLSASVPHRARIGLVGPNGVGKTTLLRLLAGLSKPAAGAIHIARGTTIGYLRQEAALAFADQDNTVYEEMLTVFAGLQAQAEELRQMETAMSEGDFSQALLDRYGEVQEAFEVAGGYDYEVRIQQVLEGLGFSRAHWSMPLSHCSGGQKTRALLARLLLEQPEILILDEPTNHLDVAAIEWLENRLNTWEGTIILVSHDRYFLDKVVNTIWEMSRNGIEVYRGNYSAYLGQRQERWDRRDEEFTAAMERFLNKLDFIKRNIARASSTDRAKGELKRLIREVKAVELGGVATLNQSWSAVSAEHGVSGDKWSVADVEQHIKALEHPNVRLAQLKMRLRPPHQSGRIVLRSKGLHVGYPGKPLFRADDIELFRRERAALIGPNGTGKSTFLRTLLGELEPLSGTLQLGTAVQVGYFAQVHDTLNLEESVLDALLARRPMPISEARTHLGRYLFRGEDVFKPVKALSGGERGRLALAILALEGANFLLLDEPTNHLDLPAQEALQEALHYFDGTVLLVSHDRYLVDKLATQVWELRDGRLHVHKGDYRSFLEARQQAEERARQATAVRPSRNGAAGSTGGEEVAGMETRIEAMELELRRLGERLQAATEAQEWSRLPALNQEYQQAQARLERLMEEWEEMMLMKES